MKYFCNSILIVLVFFLILLSACTKESPKKKHLKVEMVLSDKIILEEKHDSYIGEAADLKVDEKGFIYYGDRALNQVVVFNEKGKQIRRIGKDGKGPSEIDKLLGLDVRYGKVSMFDGGQLKVVVYDTLGNYITYFSLISDPDSYPYGNTVVNRSDGKILVSESSTTFGGDWEVFVKSSWLITEYDSTGMRVKHFAKIDKKAITQELYKLSLLGVPRAYLDKDDNLYLAIMSLPIIHKYNRNGQLVNKMDLQSSNFISAYKYKQETDKVIRKRTSQIICIGHLENQDFLVNIHYNFNDKSSGIRVSRDNLKVFLSVYDVKTNTLLNDIDITQILNRTFYVIAIKNDFLYFITDISPANVTIGKYYLKTKMDNQERKAKVK